MNFKLFRSGLILIVVILMLGVVANAVTPRIATKNSRIRDIEKLEAILNYHNPVIEEEGPYAINPFFFEQPLLLKLMVPGGISDMDILNSFRSIIVEDITGVLIGGGKQFLTLTENRKLKESDRITEVLPELGGIEAWVTVGPIRSNSFVLKRNDAEITVDLSKQAE